MAKCPICVIRPRRPEKFLVPLSINLNDWQVMADIMIINRPGHVHLGLS